MTTNGRSLLLWVFFVHLAGLYLYTRGFLLTRLSLPDVASCEDGHCNITPIHKRAIVLVIDALRYDFLSPHPPEPLSPHHHHVLSLPQELTRARPSHSLLFEMFSDPPTTTLQRLKGITTGSLPTFMDMGSNFASSAITEDSFIGQLGLAGKKIAFMGDDTWTTVFPDSFQPNMTFPYDSFNVEDLHTVDEGVMEHLFPILEDKDKPWDLLIGHFLGVDHVGHRVGPDHPFMKAKLAQMDEVMRRVVALLEDDTLLILMGDHGMDKKGDHGGDGDHETSAALWVYSKGPQLVHPKASIPSALLPKRVFPGATMEHRHIQQIDLAPTLSLVFGLPIPFNNLGTVIPELFWQDEMGESFTGAISRNALQVKNYMNTYRLSSSGAELGNAWAELERLWATVKLDGSPASPEAQWLAMTEYTRAALSVCRSLWAQFNVSLMLLGLVLIATGLASTTLLYVKFANLQENWEPWVTELRRRCLFTALGGGTVGLVVYALVLRFVKQVSLFETILFGAAFASSIAVTVHACPTTRPSLRSLTSLPLPLILHAAAFASNSFTVWEDKIVSFLLVSSIVPAFLVGFRAPTPRLRYRIIGFSILFAVCTRLMAVSTACREEQAPYCHVTFYAPSSLSWPYLGIFIPIVFALPWSIKRFLQISKSDRGTAAIIITWLLPATLFLGTTVWVLEQIESSGTFGPEWSNSLDMARKTSARFAMGSVVFLGYSLWWLVPLCLDMSTRTKPDPATPGKTKREVTILGFANAYGAPYLMFWTLFLALVYPATQLVGQAVLALATVAILAYLEVVDSVRDVRALESAFAAGTPSAFLTPQAPPRPALRFSEITPLALLAVHAFFATGHQAAIPSMQWKTAFVLTPTVSYPLSPLLVALNTVGPPALVVLAAPLLALWNAPPVPVRAQDARVRGDAVRAGLGAMLYCAGLLLGSAACAAWLRRHLMVWKIFAPRFMLAGVMVVAVDAAVLVGVAVGVARVSGRVSRLFGAMANAGA